MPTESQHTPSRQTEYRNTAKAIESAQYEIGSSLAANAADDLHLAADYIDRLLEALDWAAKSIKVRTLIGGKVVVDRPGICDVIGRTANAPIGDAPLELRRRLEALDG